MRRPLRLQLKSRWADEEREPPPPPLGPPPRAFKLLALLGIVLFWLYYLGWLGEGGQAGLETGFMLFALGQLPLMWHWMRANMRRRR